MNGSTVFIIALISVATVAFIHRLSSTTAHRSFVSGRNLFYFIMVNGAIWGAIKIYSPSSNLSNGLFSTSVCPIPIIPQEFADMVNHDEDYCAGIFYDKKFQRKIDMETRDNTEVTIYTYKLIHNSFWGGHEDEDERVPQYGYILSSRPRWVFYVVRKRKLYNDFFEYLKSIGADSLPPDKFSNYQALSGDAVSYKFDGCVFVDRGFVSKNQGCTIQVYKYELLQPKGLSN